MYHETTFEELRRQRARRIRLVVALVLAVVLARIAIVAGRTLTREQGAAALRESVMRTALQCCAIEGSFPTTVRHLEEHYGLVINERDYRISYEWMGDNVPPSVVVTLR